MTRRLLTAILASFVMTFGASAQDAASPARPHLTFDQVRDLIGGLVALDGRQRVVKDGQQERIVPQEYDLAPGIRLVIAQNLLRAKNTFAPLQPAFAAVQRQFADANGKVPDERLVEFNLAVRKLQDSLTDADFIPIKYEELKPSVNNFPPSVIAALLPILVMEDKK